jgi:hypothetical protein
VPVGDRVSGEEDPAVAIELPPAKSVAVNPTQEELRSWVEQMPNSQPTEFGNFNVKAKVTARSAGATFVVTDDPGPISKQAMSRADYEQVARRQEEYIARSGHDPDRGVHRAGELAAQAPRPRLHRARQREHPGDAAAAVLPQGRGLA